MKHVLGREVFDMRDRFRDDSTYLYSVLLDAGWETILQTIHERRAT
jgi:hypothetical protein